MPRPKSITQPAILDRESTIKALLADPFGVVVRGAAHPLLEHFTPRERKRMLREVEREQWRRREAKRLPILMERLRTWTVSQWGDVFCEMPELEETLTAEQKERWETWRASRKGQGW